MTGCRDGNPDRVISRQIGSGRQEKRGTRGHYIQDGIEYYNNCADHSVKIEIDDWGSNTIMCVPAWTTNELGSDFDISSVWMISTHC